MHIAHPCHVPFARSFPLHYPTLLILLLAAPTLAASICGTVTDDRTAAPVARAGVFLRDAAGAYTGDHTATDDEGRFCLGGLFAGTYTLEVRVDDYLVCWRTGVEVADDITDVPLAADLPALRLLPPWPNPAAGEATLKVVLRQQAPVEVGVYDARGRRLRAWATAAAPAEGIEFTWDGRGPDGRPLPSGLYLVRARSGDATVVRGLVLAR